MFESVDRRTHARTDTGSMSMRVVRKVLRLVLSKGQNISPNNIGGHQELHNVILG